MRRPVAIGIILVLVLGFAAAAVGSSHTSRGSGGGSPASANLVAGDLPAGWTQTPAQATADPLAPILTCLHIPGTRTVVQATPSPSFSNGAMNASSTVSVVQPASYVAAEVPALKGPAGAGCIHDSLAQAVPGAQVAIQTIGSTGSSYGFRAVLQQGNNQLDADIVLVTSGTTELVLAFDSAAGPFDASIEESALARATARLSGA